MKFNLSFILSIRRQKKNALPKRELEQVRAELFDKLNSDFAFIEFRHPQRSTVWDKADDYCSDTCISAPDVIHLASAIELNCDILVTRDDDFREIADEFILTIFPEQIQNALKQLTQSI